MKRANGMLMSGSMSASQQELPSGESPLKLQSEYLDKSIHLTTIMLEK